MVQQWCCDNCGISGAASHAKHADVYTVLNALADDHKARSPKCSTGHLKMRVRNPELCSAEQWRDVKNDSKRLFRQRAAASCLVNRGSR